MTCLSVLPFSRLLNMHKPQKCRWHSMRSCLVLLYGWDASKCLQGSVLVPSFPHGHDPFSVGFTPKLCACCKTVSCAEQVWRSVLFVMSPKLVLVERQVGDPCLPKSWCSYVHLLVGWLVCFSKMRRILCLVKLSLIDTDNNVLIRPSAWACGGL